jgi:hypothetical protein
LKSWALAVDLHIPSPARTLGNNIFEMWVPKQLTDEHKTGISGNMDAIFALIP